MRAEKARTAYCDIASHDGMEDRLRDSETEANKLALVLTRTCDERDLMVEGCRQHRERAEQAEAARAELEDTVTLLRQERGVLLTRIESLSAERDARPTWAQLTRLRGALQPFLQLLPPWTRERNFVVEDPRDGHAVASIPWDWVREWDAALAAAPRPSEDQD